MTIIIKSNHKDMDGGIFQPKVGGMEANKKIGKAIEVKID